MQPYIAQFKILYNPENGRHMDMNDGKEALKLRCSLYLTTLLDLTSLVYVAYRYVRIRSRKRRTRLFRCYLSAAPLRDRRSKYGPARKKRLKLQPGPPALTLSAALIRNLSFFCFGLLACGTPQPSAANLREC